MATVFDPNVRRCPTCEGREEPCCRCDSTGFLVVDSATGAESALPREAPAPKSEPRPTPAAAIAPRADAPLVITYGVTQEQIAQTRQRYASLEATTPKGYEEVRLAIAECRSTRVAIENRRKELKADALEYGRKVDAAAKTLTSMLEQIEEPLKAKKAVVDAEKARVKAEKEAAEKAALEARLRAEREAEEQRLAAEREAQRIEAERLAAERAKLDEERRAIEEARRAEEARARAAREEEEQRLAAERAELDRQRRETERLELERRARVEAERRAEQARIEAEEARVREAERQAALAARLEALRPDAEKLQAYAASIRNLTPPDVRDQEARDIVAGVQSALDEVARELEQLVRGMGR